jgi:hypothetical protein
MSSAEWAAKLNEYVRSGVVVLNAAQTKGLSAEFLGVRFLNSTSEADDAKCLAAGEAPQDLSGQLFRYEKIAAAGSDVLMQTTSGDPLVTVKKVGRGKVIFCALPDFLGEDERVTPFAAHLLTHIFTDATPVRVDGDVEKIINRTDKGWVVTLFNNNGVYKPQQGMAEVDRSAVITATVRLHSGAIQSAQEWISDRKLEIKGSKVSVNISPGGVAVVEITGP